MLCGVLPSQLQAQADKPPSKPLLNRAAERGYILGAGDQVNIHVVDLEEYSDRTLKINPEGDLDLPLVGQYHASGETLELFKSELQRILSRYINSPKISINLLTSHSNKVSVLGAVSSPGVHELTGPTTLIEAISEAGGLKNDAGSTVVITRSNDVGQLPVDGRTFDSTGTFTTATLSLDDLMLSKRPTENILLRPGDIVSVPKASIVYVVGDVHRSGGFPISSHSRMSVLQAISLAEGLSNNNASRSAKILRPSPNGEGKPIEIPVNVQAIFAGKAVDPPLFAEDILFIPHSAMEAGAKRAAEIALQVATGVLIYR